jgi:hypothetical protein
LPEILDGNLIISGCEYLKDLEGLPKQIKGNLTLKYLYALENYDYLNKIEVETIEFISLTQHVNLHLKNDIRKISIIDCAFESIKIDKNVEKLEIKCKRKTYIKEIDINEVNEFSAKMIKISSFKYKHIYVCDLTNWTELDDKKPNYENIDRLSLDNYVSKSNKANTLDLSHTNMKYLFIANNNDLDEIKLPKSLEELYLSSMPMLDCSNFDFSDFEKLKKITIINIDLGKAKKDMIFPEHLELFNIYSTKIDDFEFKKPPKTIKRLVIGDKTLKSFKGLKNVEELFYLSGLADDFDYMSILDLDNPPKSFNYDLVHGDIEKSMLGIVENLVKKYKVLFDLKVKNKREIINKISKLFFRKK